MQMRMMEKMRMTTTMNNLPWLVYAIATCVPRVLQIFTRDAKKSTRAEHLGDVWHFYRVRGHTCRFGNLIGQVYSSIPSLDDDFDG